MNSRGMLSSHNYSFLCGSLTPNVNKQSRNQPLGWYFILKIIMPLYFIPIGHLIPSPSIPSCYYIQNRFIVFKTLRSCFIEINLIATNNFIKQKKIIKIFLHYCTNYHKGNEGITIFSLFQLPLLLSTGHVAHVSFT